MSQGAKVSSVDAIRAFKIAMINFAEDARSGLSSTDMEIRQARNWLQRDQLTYWQAQVKRWQEKISNARTELHRRQLMQTNSSAVSDTEQKETVREAQRKLHEAEEKVQTIKRWIPLLDHAIAEYESQAQPLGDRLSGSFVASLNVLDRMTAALDSYLAMAPPTTPMPAMPRIETPDTPSQAASQAPAARAEEATAEPSNGASPPATAEGQVEANTAREDVAAAEAGVETR